MNRYQGLHKGKQLFDPKQEEDKVGKFNLKLFDAKFSLKKRMDSNKILQVRESG